MSAYAIVQINVTNPELYKDYLKKVTPIVEKYNGEYVVRGGNFKKMLGNDHCKSPRVINTDKAKAFPPAFEQA